MIKFKVGYDQIELLFFNKKLIIILEFDNFCLECLIRVFFLLENVQVINDGNFRIIVCLIVQNFFVLSFLLLEVLSMSD